MDQISLDNPSFEGMYTYTEVTEKNEKLVTSQQKRYTWFCDFLLLLLFLKSLHLVYVSMCRCACHSTCVEIWEHFVELVSFLLLYGFWGNKRGTLGL